MTVPALILGAYLLGAIPFGLLLARCVAGVDVRATGSGNIGATNVARTVGKSVGIAVLALDAIKGALPVLAARLIEPETTWLPAAAGAAAIAGHVYPVYLRFRGGKGVATSFGVFLVLMPWAMLAGVVAFAATFAVVRIVSAGSLVGALVACGASFGVYGMHPATWLLSVAVSLILWRHRGNIARMLHHEEHRL